MAGGQNPVDLPLFDDDDDVFIAFDLEAAVSQHPTSRPAALGTSLASQVQRPMDQRGSHAPQSYLDGSKYMSYAGSQAVNLRNITRTAPTSSQQPEEKPNKESDMRAQEQLDSLGTELERLRRDLRVAEGETTILRARMKVNETENVDLRKKLAEAKSSRKDAEEIKGFMKQIDDLKAALAFKENENVQLRMTAIDSSRARTPSPQQRATDALRKGPQLRTPAQGSTSGNRPSSSLRLRNRTPAAAAATSSTPNTRSLRRKRSPSSTKIMSPNTLFGGDIPAFDLDALEQNALSQRKDTSIDEGELSTSTVAVNTEPISDGAAAIPLLGSGAVRDTGALGSPMEVLRRWFAEVPDSLEYVLRSRFVWNSSVRCGESTKSISFDLSSALLGEIRKFSTVPRKQLDRNWSHVVVVLEYMLRLCMSAWNVSGLVHLLRLVRVLFERPGVSTSVFRDDSASANDARRHMDELNAQFDALCGAVWTHKECLRPMQLDGPDGRQPKTQSAIFDPAEMSDLRGSSETNTSAEAFVDYVASSKRTLLSSLDAIAGHARNAETDDNRVDYGFVGWCKTAQLAAMPLGLLACYIDLDIGRIFPADAQTPTAAAAVTSEADSPTAISSSACLSAGFIHVLLVLYRTMTRPFKRSASDGTGGTAYGDRRPLASTGDTEFVLGLVVEVLTIVASTPQKHPVVSVSLGQFFAQQMFAVICGRTATDLEKLKVPVLHLVSTCVTELPGTFSLFSRWSQSRYVYTSARFRKLVDLDSIQAKSFSAMDPVHSHLVDVCVSIIRAVDVEDDRRMTGSDAPDTGIELSAVTDLGELRKWCAKHRSSILQAVSMYLVPLMNGVVLHVYDLLSPASDHPQRAIDAAMRRLRSVGHAVSLLSATLSGPAVLTVERYPLQSAVQVLGFIKNDFLHEREAPPWFDDLLSELVEIGEDVHDAANEDPEGFEEA